MLFKTLWRSSREKYIKKIVGIDLSPDCLGVRYGVRSRSVVGSGVGSVVGSEFESGVESGVGYRVGRLCLR